MTTIDIESTGTPDKTVPTPSRKINWFGAFWRWHFYGALLVIPVLFVLAVTGMTYLFRAQIDAAMHPGVITVAVPDGADRLPLSSQQEAVAAEFPDRSVVSLFDSLGDRYWSKTFIEAKRALAMAPTTNIARN